MKGAMHKATTQDSRYVREDLVKKARELVPVLTQRATEAEQLRRIPDETVEDLRAAGLLRAATPPEFGGYEGADYDLSLEIAAELGRGCVSTAWCYQASGSTDLHAHAGSDRHLDWLERQDHRSYQKALWLQRSVDALLRDWARLPKV